MAEGGQESIIMRQAQLKRGMFIWIKNDEECISKGNPSWERFQISSFGRQNWVNLLRRGEDKPDHSRKLDPRGRWLLCSLQQKIPSDLTEKELEEKLLKLFKESTDESLLHDSSLDHQDNKVIDDASTTAPEQKPMQPTVLSHEMIADQGDNLLGRPLDRDNVENYSRFIDLSQTQFNITHRDNVWKTLERYSELEVAKDGHNLRNILEDLNHHIETVEGTNIGIDYVKQLVSLAVELVSVPGDYMPHLERREDIIKNGLAETIRTIREHNEPGEVIDMVAQKLHLSIGIYAKHKKERISNLPLGNLSDKSSNDPPIAGNIKISPTDSFEKEFRRPMEACYPNLEDFDLTNEDVERLSAQLSSSNRSADMSITCGDKSSSDDLYTTMGDLAGDQLKREKAINPPEWEEKYKVLSETIAKKDQAIKEMKDYMYRKENQFRELIKKQEIEYSNQKGKDFEEVSRLMKLRETERADLRQQMETDRSEMERFKTSQRKAFWGAKKSEHDTRMRMMEVEVEMSNMAKMMNEFRLTAGEQIADKDAKIKGQRRELEKEMDMKAKGMTKLSAINAEYHEKVQATMNIVREKESELEEERKRNQMLEKALHEKKKRSRKRSTSSSDTDNSSMEGEQVKLLGLKSSRRISTKVKSTAIKLVGKMEELESRTQFVNKSVIINKIELISLNNSSIIDAHKQEERMLEKGEKLQHLHFQARELHMTIRKYLTESNEEKNQRLFSLSESAYNEILRTVKDIKEQMEQRALVTNMMPSYISKAMTLPTFTGEALPHIYSFKKEINGLLCKQNIPKENRGVFIKGQIRGIAATILNSEINSYSDPTDDQIFEILQKHYGEVYYITTIILKEHSKIGVIPGPDKGWSKIYKASTKHASLIKQMTNLQESKAMGSIVDAQYVHHILDFLGHDRQDRLTASSYFDKNLNEKFDAIKDVYFSLESQSSRLQVTVNKKHQPDDVFIGVSERSNYQDPSVQAAIEEIKDLGRPQYTGPVMPTNTHKTVFDNDYKSNVTCYRCEQKGHYANACNAITASFHCRNCGDVGNHITSNCPRPQKVPQATTTILQPKNIAQVPGSQEGHMVCCYICKTAAERDKVAETRAKHYFTNAGRLERHLCPRIIEKPHITDQVSFLKNLGICLACLNGKLNDEKHINGYCDMLVPEKFTYLRCEFPGCKIRRLLCVDHINQNKNSLEAHRDKISKMHYNLIFLTQMESLSATSNNMASRMNIAHRQQLPPFDNQTNSAMIVSEEGKDNLYDSIEQMINSTSTQILPLNEGAPHFMLYRMASLTGEPVLIAFDSCASFSVFRSDVLGKSVAAVEMKTNGDNYLKGIGGRQKAKSFCALLPLHNSSSHQLIACQSVDSITDVKTADTRNIVNYVKSNYQDIKIERAGSSPTDYLKKIQDCYNFARMGPLAPIQGLIGINDIKLMPNLVLETSIGVNFYQVPIAGFDGVNICIGGSIPTIVNIQDILGTQLINSMTNICYLSNDMYRDYMGSPIVSVEEIHRQEMAVFDNLKNQSFLPLTSDDDTKIYISDIDDFFEEDEYNRLSKNHSKEVNLADKTTPSSTNADETEDGQLRFENNDLRTNSIDSLAYNKGSTYICLDHSVLQNIAAIHSPTGLANNTSTKALINSIYDPWVTDSQNKSSFQLNDELHKFLLSDNQVSKKRGQIVSRVINRLFDLSPPQKSWGTSDEDGVPWSVSLVTRIELGEEITTTQEKPSFKADFYNTFMDRDLQDFRCAKCLLCSKCKNISQDRTISIKAEIENMVLDQSVTIDTELNKLVACLPLPQSYSDLLVNNREHCIKRLRNSLRKLQKMPIEEQTQLKESVQKLVTRGFISAVQDLTEAEAAILNKTAGEYYLPTSIVFKSSSISTPSRLCLDGSAKTKSGFSLNCLLPKGDINLNLPKLVQNWHLRTYAISGDMSSFYNRIHLTPEHWHLQRFFWIPSLNPDDEVQIFIIKTLIYGIKSSAAQCEFGLTKICQIHPRLSKFLSMRYVDDCADSYFDKKRLEEETDYAIRTLEMYGLHFKSRSFAVTGKDPPQEISNNGEVSVGSYKWFPKHDHFLCNVPVIFLGTKQRGSFTSLKVFKGKSISDLLEFFPKNFTLRDLLSKAASFFDAGIGILTPLIAELRFLVRETMIQGKCDRGINWNFIVPGSIMEKFCKVLVEIMKLGTFKYARCQIRERIRGAEGHLLCFADSGDFETLIIYIVFPLDDGHWTCSLVTAKSYLKKDKATVPMSEMNACSLGAQITKQVMINLKGLIKECFLFTDSTITLAWLHNNHNVLSTYHRNRATMCLSVFKHENMYHVVSRENAADLISRRNISASALDPESTFYNGPTWIRTGLEKAAEDGHITKAENITQVKQGDNHHYQQGISMRAFRDANIDSLKRKNPEEDEGRDIHNQMLSSLTAEIIDASDSNQEEEESPDNNYTSQDTQEETHSSKSLENTISTSPPQENSAVGKEEAEMIKVSQSYYFQIELQAKHISTLQMYQDKIIACNPEFKKFRRNIKFPHITLAYFSIDPKLHNSKSIVDITKALGRELKTDESGPSSVWNNFLLSLDELLQFDDCSVHLSTTAQRQKLKDLHELIANVLCNVDIKPDLPEGSYNPHVSLFKAPTISTILTEGDKREVMLSGGIITQNISKISLVEAASYSIIDSWDLTVKGQCNNNDMVNLTSQEATYSQHHNFLKNNICNVIHNYIEIDRKPINEAIRRHNHDLAATSLITLRSGKYTHEDKTPTSRTTTDLTRIIEQTNPQDGDLSGGGFDDDSEQCHQIQDIRLLSANDTRSGVIKSSSNENKMPDNWSVHTTRQLKESRLLLNPLRFNFRKNLRIGALVVSFLHKLLRKFPEKQQQILSLSNFTNGNALFTQWDTEEIGDRWVWESRLNDDKVRYKQVVDLTENLMLFSSTSSTIGLQIMRDYNEFKVIKDNHDQLIKKRAEINLRDLGITEESTNENHQCDVTKVINQTAHKLGEMAAKINASLELRYGTCLNTSPLRPEVNPMNPLGLHALKNLKAKGWLSYPGLDDLVSRIYNFSNYLQKMPACTTSNEILKHSFLLLHWCKFATCMTQKHCRQPVKELGETLLFDLNSMYVILDKPEYKHVLLRIQLATQNDLTDDQKQHLKQPMNPGKSVKQARSPLKPLKKLPDDANYFQCMKTVAWSHICTLTTMGQLTKATQNYMRKYWTSAKLSQHTNEAPNGLLLSNQRWGQLDDFQTGSHSQSLSTDLKGVKFGGNVPVLDKHSPWFLSLCLFIHREYRVIKPNTKALDTHHKGLTQNYIDLLQYVNSPGALSILKKIRDSCFICRKRAKMMIKESYSSIHHAQLSFTKPFTKVNLDIAGPFFVKSTLYERVTRANPSRIKTWVLVVVCSFSRAISLEIVESMQVSAISDAMTRHMCRHGPTGFVISDRAANQVCMLEKGSWLESVRGEMYSKRGFTFELIPVSHHAYNGICENKIKYVKLILAEGDFKNSNVTIVQLNTLLQLTVNLINTVPIGVSLKENGNPLLQVITPSHFLIPKRNLHRVQLSFIDIERTGQQYFYEMKEAYNKMMQLYEKVVLPALMHKPHNYQRIGIEHIYKNDICLFKKRAQNNFTKEWSLGRVTEVIFDRDNVKRAVMLVYINLDNEVDKTGQTDSGISEVEGKQSRSKRVRCGSRVFKFTAHNTHRQVSELIKLYPLSLDSFQNHLRVLEKWTGNQDDSATEVCGELENSAEHGPGQVSL